MQANDPPSPFPIQANYPPSPFLKSECVTSSFYPNTKTLNVQGMKERKMRDKLSSFITEPVEEPGPLMDDGGSQDGGEVEGLNSEEEDDLIPEIAESAEGAMNTSNASAHCCCDTNMTAILCLSRRLALLEAKVDQRNLSPSYEELLAKMKALEEERDSL